MKLGAKILGILSGTLLLYLLVGFLLPGTWQAEASRDLAYPPEAVFPHLNRMESWTHWTAMPDSGTTLFGPAEGPGAGLRWDDPRYGSGHARITENRPGRSVEYRVEIQGGALKVRGILSLTPLATGSRIHWVEEGDFGWSPLMGYAARGMASSQNEAMEAGLGRLEELLEGG